MKNIIKKGRGIEIFNNIKDILYFLSQKLVNTYWVL